MQTKKAFRKLKRFSRKTKSRQKNKILKKNVSRRMKLFRNVGGRSPKTESLVIDKNKKILGRFYMNECRYCIEMQEEWDKLIDDKEFLEKVQVFDIESKAQDDFIEKFQYKIDNNEIFNKLKKSYPTIFKVDVTKKSIDYYSGKRKADAIKLWVLNPDGH
jgi:hypothetical protein